jgi:hypothetical protein
MKLSVSNQGIIDPIDSYYNSGKSYLYTAKSKRLYSPSNFKYSGYVSGLSQKINTYYKELTYIFNTLKKSEKKYERLFEEHIPKVTNLPESKYKSRIGIKDFM